MDKKRFFNVFFWNFRETTRHFSLRSLNSEYPRIFRVTGANQNARKLLSEHEVRKFSMLTFAKDWKLGKFSRRKKRNTHVYGTMGLSCITFRKLPPRWYIPLPSRKLCILLARFIFLSKRDLKKYSLHQISFSSMSHLSISPNESLCHFRHVFWYLTCRMRLFKYGSRNRGLFPWSGLGLS